MSEVHGIAASITCTGVTAGLRSGRLRIENDLPEITDFADGGYRKYMSGLEGWTLEADGWWDAANASAWPGNDVSIVMYVNGTANSFTGDAKIRSLDIGAIVDAVVTAAFSIQGNGQLVPA